MDIETDGWPGTGDIVVIRTGHNLVLVSSISVGGRQVDDALEDIARLTMENLAG